MLLSRPKSKRRGLGSAVTGRAWPDSRIPPLLRAALAAEPLLPLRPRLFQEGEEQPELLLPRRPSAASCPQGPGVCGSRPPGLTASWGRDTQSPGPGCGSHPQPF